MEAPVIPQRIPDCKADFGRLIASSGSTSAPAWMEDRQANFNIWAASFNKRSSSESSLDHRLRDRNNASKVTCRHLEGLLEALEKILEIGYLSAQNLGCQAKSQNQCPRGSSRLRLKKSPYASQINQMSNKTLDQKLPIRSRLRLVMRLKMTA